MIRAAPMMAGLPLAGDLLDLAATARHAGGRRPDLQAALEMVIPRGPEAGRRLGDVAERPEGPDWLAWASRRTWPAAFEIAIQVVAERT